MSYTNTFIQVAPDCPVVSGVEPVARGESKPIHVIQYELLRDNPYLFTHEELLFEVHIRHKGITSEQLQTERAIIWDQLFQKMHPCLRASLLPKKYGWGIHYDAQGKIALYGMESPQYQRFVQADKSGVTLLAALRSKRG